MTGNFFEELQVASGKLQEFYNEDGKNRRHRRCGGAGLPSFENKNRRHRGCGGAGLGKRKYKKGEILKMKSFQHT